jgi:hypothetical protein
LRVTGDFLRLGYAVLLQGQADGRIVDGRGLFLTNSQHIVQEPAQDLTVSRPVGAVGPGQEVRVCRRVIDIAAGAGEIQHLDAVGLALGIGQRPGHVLRRGLRVVPLGVLDKGDRLVAILVGVLRLHISDVPGAVG